MRHGIIEIIGPPGIGKSTIYRVLCKTWRPYEKWIYQDALLQPSKPHISEISKWLEFQFRKRFSKKMSRAIPIDYGLRFIDNNHEFVDFCWEQLLKTKNINKTNVDDRFRSAYFLFTDFCRYQAILESNCSKPCIINEGLLQKSFLIQDDIHVMRDSITQYLSLLPLPSAVIYINAFNPEVIMERLRTRKKVIASHISKSNEELRINISKWQYLLNAILEKANENKIPTFSINGERPINENVFSLKTFLNSFDKHLSFIPRNGYLKKTVQKL